MPSPLVADHYYVNFNPPPCEEPYWNRKIETMPRRELVKVRDFKIRRIIKWAYEKSPFYHKRFRELGIAPDDVKGYGDLSKVPVLFKVDLRKDQYENPPLGSIAVPDLASEAVRLYSTTGTTGTPTLSAWTREEWDYAIECTARLAHWMPGGRPGEGYMLFLPFERYYGGGPFFADAAYRVGMKAYCAGTTLPIDRVVNDVERLKPEQVFGTPTFLAILGQALKESGIQPPFKRVVVGGEPLTVEARKKLQTLYPLVGGNVFEVYGSVESGGPTLVECSAHQGLHTSEDALAWEVVDPETGEVVGEGEKGELVFTCLNSFAQPLIRYSTGDIAINNWVFEACPCGRTHARMAEIPKGRATHVVKVGATSLLPIDVERTLAGLPETTGNFQIVVEADQMEKLKLKVESSKDRPTRDDEHKIVSILEASLQVPIDLELLPKGGLPTWTFKAVRIVDLRKIGKERLSGKETV